MTNQDHITDAGRPGKYFHIMLNMADDELDVYQYRLLGHYRRVCGDTSDGACWEGTRTTAARCKMSVGKVVKTRRELQRLGYIAIEERADDTLRITVIDRMKDNVARYSERSPHEQCVHQVNGTVHHMNAGVHQVNERITTTEKEKPIKKTRARAGAKAVQSSDTVPSSKRKKPTVEQEFRAAWNEHAAVGNALRAAFGDDFVPAENCPRANLERYLEAAQQLGAAGCKPEDVESLHTYVKRRAKTEEWSVKFGPLALARHYTDYLKARKNAEERRQQDAELVIVPVSMERQPFGPARERIAS